ALERVVLRLVELGVVVDLDGDVAAVLLRAAEELERAIGDTGAALAEERAADVEEARSAGALVLQRCLFLLERLLVVLRVLDELLRVVVRVDFVLIDQRLHALEIVAEKLRALLERQVDERVGQRAAADVAVRVLVLPEVAVRERRVERVRLLRT